MHAVPLEDIHFDTFGAGAVTLAEASPQQIIDLLDRIPPIDDPVYRGRRDGRWMHDDDLVLGFVSPSGQPYAYPHKILNWHEIVNDQIDGVPLLVSYCPLCRSGVVYDRRVGGRTLTFSNTSALYDSDLVMVDRETSSYWWQVPGRAIVGTMTGSDLEPLASSTMPWARWRRLHPDTLVLSRDTGFERDYSRDSFAGYDDAVAEGRFSFPVSAAARDDRLSAAETVIAVAVDDEIVVYPLDSLGNAAVNDRVGGAAVVVFSLARGPAGAAFDRTVGERILSFVRRDGAFRDRQTGSVWTLAGEASRGPMAGTRLTAIPSRTSFWFATIAAFPEAQVYRRR